jgi:hypothetical protein
MLKSRLGRRYLVPREKYGRVELPRRFEKLDLGVLEEYHGDGGPDDDFLFQIEHLVGAKHLAYSEPATEEEEDSDDVDEMPSD